jgi:putative transposase
LQVGSINPVAPLKKFSLTKETSSTAQSVAEDRSSPSIPSCDSLPEATAPQILPDFDTF